MLPCANSTIALNAAMLQELFLWVLQFWRAVVVSPLFVNVVLQGILLQMLLLYTLVLCVLLMCAVAGVTASNALRVNILKY